MTSGWRRGARLHIIRFDSYGVLEAEHISVKIGFRFCLARRRLRSLGNNYGWL